MKVPIDTHAMLLAGETLFVAGSGGKDNPKGGTLWTYSSADGTKLSELPVDDAPIFDGLAAAGGKVYLATKSGQVMCFNAK